MSHVRRASLLVALAVAATSGCGGRSTDLLTTPGRSSALLPSGTEVPVVRLRAEPYSFAYYSAMQESQRLVVRAAVTWSSVWTGIVGSQRPAPAPPAIDFSKEMVVVASLGARPSGGYSILIQAATMTDDGLYVQVRTISPGRNCAVTAALTQPVDVARLPATDRAVHFVEDPIVKDCE